ncbi:MAG: PilN domain-containing protein, partial [Bdellovibrionales bacterium]|nr:PilN domain-containing protein [Bdellovibrionales bacterium]NQZ20224.1 PilN domain-containing protein [Bdellovibrionales bacterium]
KWSYTAKLACIAYFAYLAYGITMEQIATGLEEKSNDNLIEQAGKVAKLRGGSATQSKIKAYVKANNKRAKLVKVYDEISEINTPVKWIHDVSQILPNNKANKQYEVRQFFVKNKEVTIQGVAKDDKAVASLLKALKGIAISGKVNPVRATILKEPGKKLFAYKFNINRKN